VSTVETQPLIFSVKYLAQGSRLDPIGFFLFSPLDIFLGPSAHAND